MLEELLIRYRSLITRYAMPRLLVFLITFCCALRAQTPAAATPTSITFQDALQRARQFGVAFQTANIAAQLAREDRVQAKAGMLPNVNHFTQYIYTQGNGTPSGVFIANDGVHVYNEWGNVHEDFSFGRYADYRRALANEAIARARADIALRGLNNTIAHDYYGLVIAQRRYANSQRALEEAAHFVDITRKQEAGGEAAHADVIKADLQFHQRERENMDARLAIERATVTLSVLIFPDFNMQFTVVDDLQTAGPLAAFPEIQKLASTNNPDLRVAQAAIREANLGIASARDAYLPSFSFDYWYGIDANVFAVRGPDNRKNLGSSAQGSMTIPVWNWGATRSRIRQAELRGKQAQLELSLAQRQLLANLNAFYREAEVARAQLDSLKKSVDDAAESLRLTLLRYQAGEATALEVVDAQSTLATARNAYDDGLSRYRLGVANLQTLTGPF
jgi:outer membrane protein TolC